MVKLDAKKLLRTFVVRINSFLLQLFYFISLSLVGFGILKLLNTKTSFVPRDIDFLFTSVSAATDSSMSTVEIEVFSNGQLVVMIVLMFVGSEVFVSMVGLHLRRCKIIRKWKSEGRVKSVTNKEPIFANVIDSFDQTESTRINVHESGHVSLRNDVLSTYKPSVYYDSIRLLGFVVLGYLIVIHVFGIAFVLIYLHAVSGAKEVLRNKRLNIVTFSFFTVVSTFASCGFVPTNENMIVFRGNSGLLWILMPQVLLGNTLYPSALRFLIWVLGKKCKNESEYLLQNEQEIGFFHLLPSVHSILLVGTVFGFILIGFIIFSIMEWNSAGLSGLSTYQKVVGVLFENVSARHTGETIVDLSTIAPAILVFFVVMMYLPPYTSFLPVANNKGSSQRRKVGENFILSQLSYLSIFVILVCVTEKKNLKNDPINFSILNIVIEVISAYGNVGFTTGYGCSRQITPDPSCVDKWYGFAGKWSDEAWSSSYEVSRGARAVLISAFHLHEYRTGYKWKLNNNIVSKESNSGIGCIILPDHKANSHSGA